MSCYSVEAKGFTYKVDCLDIHAGARRVGVGGIPSHGKIGSSEKVLATCSHPSITI